MKIEIKLAVAAVCLSELVVFLTHMYSILTNVGFNLKTYYTVPIGVLMIIIIMFTTVATISWITKDLDK